MTLVISTIRAFYSFVCGKSDNLVNTSTTKDHKKGVRQNGFTTKVASPKVAEMVFCSAGVSLHKAKCLKHHGQNDRQGPEGHDNLLCIQARGERHKIAWRCTASSNPDNNSDIMQCCGCQATHVDSTTKSGICLSNYWQSSCGNTCNKCSYACAIKQSICSFRLHPNTDTTGLWGCSQRSYPSRIYAHVGWLRTSRMWAACQVFMWTRHSHTWNLQVPNEVTDYYLQRVGFECEDVRLCVHCFDFNLLRADCPRYPESAS